MLTPTPKEILRQLPFTLKTGWTIEQVIVEEKLTFLSTVLARCPICSKTKPVQLKTVLYSRSKKCPRCNMREIKNKKQRETPKTNQLSMRIDKDLMVRFRDKVNQDNLFAKDIIEKLIAEWVASN